MRFVILGSSELTLDFFKVIKKSNHEIASLISLNKENLPNNPANIGKFAKKNNIEYFETGDINSIESIRFLKSLEADFFVSTWSKIISNKVLEIPKFGIIGTHPTPIPMNKGRHPLHWMIALKIKKSQLSFFLMDEGIDTGNVLLRESFNLGKDIISANNNVNKAASKGLKKVLKLLDKDPSFLGQKQSKLNANTWRKRSEHDISIDPRMSAEIIIRIIRSFCKPYPMARLYIGKDLYLNLVSAKLLKEEKLRKNWVNYEYGHIFKSFRDEIWMKVDKGVILLKVDCSKIEIDLEELKGQKIFPPSYYFA